MRRPYSVIARSPVGNIIFQEHAIDENGNVPDQALIGGAREMAIAEGQLSEIEAEIATWSVEDRAL